MAADPATGRDRFLENRRAPAATSVFTSIANWSTSGLKDIEWRGEKYLWSKSREFLRFVAAPKKSGEPFELATDIKDEKTRTRFLANGWRFCSPHQMSVDYWQYRDYIRRSKGEFTVAKDQYVRLHTGWFSDRSACYLAAGRPVITQQTGFTDHYGNARRTLRLRVVRRNRRSGARDQRRLQKTQPGRACARLRSLRSGKGCRPVARPRWNLRPLSLEAPRSAAQKEQDYDDTTKSRKDTKKSGQTSNLYSFVHFESPAVASHPLRVSFVVIRGQP